MSRKSHKSAAVVATSAVAPKGNKQPKAKGSATSNPKGKGEKQPKATAVVQPQTDANGNPLNKLGNRKGMAGSGRYPKVFDAYTASGVITYLGSVGWTEAEAKAALGQLIDRLPSDATFQQDMYDGRRQAAGKPKLFTVIPELATEHVKKLQALRPKAPKANAKVSA